VSSATITVRCACGWEKTGAEDDVIVGTTEHGGRLHNMTPTRDEVLSMTVSSADDPYVTSESRRTLKRAPARPTTRSARTPKGS